jgi:hypothetical protein
MGCTCAYNEDTSNIPFTFEENKKHIISSISKKNFNNEELLRITSMSRISSQRSMSINAFKKSEAISNIKIGKSNLF